jgi:hypothetical protein
MQIILGRIASLGPPTDAAQKVSLSTEERAMADNPRTHPVHQTESTAKWRVTKGILRLTLAVAIAGAVLCVLIKSPVLARNGSQADANVPAIDPDAMDALNKMGVYLRTIKSFEVRADVTTDYVLDDGQAIQFSSKVDLVAARPDRLRVEVTDDVGHRLFFFNGKNFTIFAQVVNYYATVPAPPTLAELADNLNDKYGIELPLYDLFQWGNNEANIKKITAAVDIGPSVVDGTTCEQYAFRQAGTDWQIWIQLGDFPLPRKLVIRTLTDDAKPQHSENLTWNLAPSFSEDAFTFDPPADARRITIEDVESNKENK